MPSPHALSRGNWARSMSATLAPARRAASAAAEPAGPAPTIATSKRSMPSSMPHDAVIRCLSGRWRGHGHGMGTGVTITADDVRVLAQTTEGDPALVVVGDDVRVVPDAQAADGHLVYTKAELVAEYGEEITDVQAEVLAAGLTAQL